MLDSQRQTLLSQDASSPIFKILLIVRPGMLIDLLKLELSHEGYAVEVVHDGMSGLLKHREIKPQLIILDWHISSFSAADLCCRLRSHGNLTSILVIDTSQQNCDRPCSLPRQTSQIESDSLMYRVAALDAGADECLSFPFAMNELLARIRVQLRKHQVEKSSVLMFEDLRLNTSTREVYRGDRYIYLTTKEFALLEYLLTYPRQVLSRDRIIETVWGHDYLGDSNIIEVYIRYLRLKLEENNSKRLIYTVRRVGYVLRESSFY